ncbi:NAD-dependent epimerase/dehydratase family protein [Enterocloster bolteae]|jgi:nucleoside-diphosphate-sugar epimerase|uniref:NAD-dependent epimerase/dehydratase family protein n=1 Tax=Clostridia TaxID=186801 RepID=UPI0011066C88|nr:MULTISPECIES: NAD-dependent epimerase/dehydratase family protein [Clostridia]MCB7091780.1 NAD-dependent epimerase/dehydratase family protein [Enterocloster bolteae]MCH1938355.1 NAD-dependent epimerase/dehydratase family protein [Enterocloster sp. OA11]
MKVLLIGGTGVISTDVCKAAIEKEYDTYIVNRGNRKNSINEKATLIVADVKNESERYIKEKVGNTKYDVVVDFLSYNTNQLSKMLNCVKCNQYIFISTATIYDNHNNGKPYTEIDSKGNKGWKYCADKYECELLLKKIAAEKCINYTIIRPYVTFNMTRFPYQIAPVEYYTIVDRIFREKPIAICPNEYTTVTDSRDLAKGIVGLFGNKDAFNEDFHITSDKTTTWKHIAELLANKSGVKCHFVEVSRDSIEKMTNTVIDIPEIILDKSRNMKFDNSKIKRAVTGYNAELSIDDSIGEIYDYFKSTNHRINYLWAGCLDRILYQYGVNCDGNYKFENTKDKLKYKIGYSALLCWLYMTIKRIRQKLRR